MIISCVKWGNKFSYEHVNRLYTMVSKNIDIPFTFVCYTENPDNIHKDIQIKPLDVSLGLEKWWWKLCMFAEPSNDVNLFFDLDVVIKKDITFLSQHVVQDQVKMIEAHWKTYKLKDGDMNYNSSMLVWTGDLTHIWNKFIKDPEYWMMKYKGIDSYLYFHHNPLVFPRGIVYSRLFGIDETNCWSYDQPSKPYFDADLPVCIFNGWRRDTLNNKYLLDNDGYLDYAIYWNN